MNTRQTGSLHKSLLSVLFALSLAIFAYVSTAAPLDDVNQYADRCAAELGAGAGSYMPIGQLPNPPNYTDTVEVPVFWNEKRITYVQTGATPDAGHYLFDGVAGKKRNMPGEPGYDNTLPNEPGYPDGANTVGDITSKANLHCDFWSHVNDANGCVPGQRVMQKDVGVCKGGDKDGQICGKDAQCTNGGACKEIVTWSFVFRRVQPPVAGAPWGEFHPYYYNNMDAIAFKKDTGGVCWFDTLLTQTLTNNNWWVAPGTLAPGIPRPGGKDADKKTRAKNFWETPAQVRNAADPNERCIACHGNGPILVSRWINQGNALSRDEVPYWHPAKLLTNPIFKKFTGNMKPADQCGDSCHDEYWGVSAQTMPGGTLANAMTQNPIAPRASNYRLQIDDATGMKRVGKCAGGANNGMQCAAQADCPNGACKGGQDAGILREMPHSFDVKALDGTIVPGTPKDWDTEVKPLYDGMKDCRRTCGGGVRAGQLCADDSDCQPSPPNTCTAIDVNKCDATEQAKIPAFFGAQSLNDSVPPTKQRVAPPVPAVNYAATRKNCVVAADGSETCDYQATWDDPTSTPAGFDPVDYHAPDKYYLETNAVANQAAQTPATTKYCSAINTEVTATKTDLVGSNWAKRYTSTGALAACKKMEARLCGGYAFDSVANANDAHSPVDSRSDGDAQRGTVVTACANNIKMTRSGYRYNRSIGRYVQTVTLNNAGTDPVVGPVSYLLMNLSSNATLFNASGATACISPNGTPYRNVDIGADKVLSPGETVTLTLEFTNPSNQGITYDSRERSGAGCL